MARPALFVALAGVIVGCGSTPAGQPPAGQPPASPARSASSEGAASSVIAGTVSAGPITPVSRPGQANSRPVKGVRVEALRGADVADVTHTDHDGRFRFTLPPGTYVIVVSSAGFRFARPHRKTVIAPPNGEEVVDFVLDTGIR